MTPGQSTFDPRRLDCAVVGYGRCVASVRRVVAEAGLRSRWFPEIDDLLRRVTPSLRLVVFAPPPLDTAFDGQFRRASERFDPNTVDMLAAVADGGLCRPQPQAVNGLDVIRMPHQRDRLSQRVTAAGAA